MAPWADAGGIDPELPAGIDPRRHGRENPDGWSPIMAVRSRPRRLSDREMREALAGSAATVVYRTDTLAIVEQNDRNRMLFDDWNGRLYGTWEDTFRAIWTRRFLDAGLSGDEIGIVLDRRALDSRKAILENPHDTFYRRLPTGAIVRTDQFPTRAGDIVQSRTVLSAADNRMGDTTVWAKDFRSFAVDRPGAIVDLSVVLGSIAHRDRRALAMVTSAAELQRSNPAFMRLLRETSVLALIGRRVIAREESETRTLHRAIFDVSAAAGRRETVLVEKNPPTFVTAVSIGRELSASSAAVLLIGPVPPQDDTLAQALRRLFALTPAETRSVVALVEGQSISDVAAREGVEAQAIRARLRRARVRTGTKTDDALIDMVRRVAAVQ